MSAQNAVWESDNKVYTVKHNENIDSGFKLAHALWSSRLFESIAMAETARCLSKTLTERSLFSLWSKFSSTIGGTYSGIVAVISPARELGVTRWMNEVTLCHIYHRFGVF